MSTEDMIKWAAVAVGGWLLWKEVQKSGGLANLLNGGNGAIPGQSLLTTGTNGTAGTASSNGSNGTTGTNGNGTSSSTGGNGTATQQQEHQQAAAPARAVGLMAALVPAGALHSIDGWNYYYQQATGNSGPAPEDLGIQRTDPMPVMTLQQWASLVSGRVDLSGIRGMGNLFYAIQRGGWTQ